MSYLSQFLESKGIPSIRLASGFLLVALVIFLECRYATPANVQSMIDADLVAICSFYAIGAARLSAESFAARPNAPTSIDASGAEKISVGAGATIQTGPIETPNTPTGQTPE